MQKSSQRHMAPTEQITTFPMRFPPEVLRAMWHRLATRTPFSGLNRSMPERHALKNSYPLKVQKVKQQPQEPPPDKGGPIMTSLKSCCAVLFTGNVGRAKKSPPVFVYRQVVIAMIASLRASVSRYEVERMQDAERPSKRSGELSTAYRGRCGVVRKVSITMGVIIRIAKRGRCRASSKPLASHRGPWRL